MDKRDIDATGHPQRAQTDQSLQVERDKADAQAGAKTTAVEEEADEVVRLARKRADKLVQNARDDADHERRQHVTAPDASSTRERIRADVLLDDERSSADAVLERERTQRKRYLADFLAVEREATDSHLDSEREHADGLIAARDEFLATVSHDLRSLLGGLSLNAGLLVKQAPEGPTGDKMRWHGATNQRLVARMSRLVNDLLDVTSIEAGKLALLQEKVEIATLMRDTLDAFKPLAAAKRITLEAEADAAVLARHAWLDGGRLLQVLANLVSNALKFTPAEGRISIRIGLDADEIRFAVSDTGFGIPEGALETVFERFHQISKDRRGLGLGLHISKCIIEAHAGRMWAESKLGAGSTFHVALPASLLRDTPKSP